MDTLSSSAKQRHIAEVMKQSDPDLAAMQKDAAALHDAVVEQEERYRRAVEAEMQKKFSANGTLELEPPAPAPAPQDLHGGMPDSQKHHATERNTGTGAHSKETLARLVIGRPRLVSVERGHIDIAAPHSKRAGTSIDRRSSHVADATDIADTNAQTTKEQKKNGRAGAGADYEESIEATAEQDEFRAQMEGAEIHEEKTQEAAAYAGGRRLLKRATEEMSQ
jgi:hypothetical protein